MKKIESLFIGVALTSVIVITGGAFWYKNYNENRTENYSFPTSNFGAFLAAQHAVYINDFDRAAQFASKINDADYAIIQNTRYLTQFLSGQMPADAKLLQDEKSAPAQLIYDAYLVNQDKWDELYKRHKKDESALSAPLRIWSSVATGRSADALKFIAKLPTNESWKAFVRGQIYAETDKIAQAAESFADVRTDFMNINDYLYIMSFYRKHDMTDAADALRADFTSRPGGMFMLEYDDIPDWSRYAGTKNQLAYSLVQNVSHTQIMMYSDLAILLLRFAQITAPDFGVNNDGINYYLGQFFFNNVGDYEKYFSQINPDSPFYLFATLRRAEKGADIKQLQRAVYDNPLFVPAVNKLIAHEISNGNQRAALKIVNRALNDDNLTESGRAFFTKSRAHIYYVFGDYDDAQKDIRNASDVLPVDGEILALQAKIWAAQNREIADAYDYAMTLVKQNPTDIMAWDTLGRVVAVREGVPAALEVLARVGEVSATCSSLFEQLGDLYAKSGNIKLARDSYMRAIDLSDDGLTIVPVLKQKLRKLK